MEWIGRASAGIQIPTTAWRLPAARMELRPALRTALSFASTRAMSDGLMLCARYAGFTRLLQEFSAEARPDNVRRSASANSDATLVIVPWLVAIWT